MKVKKKETGVPGGIVVPETAMLPLSAANMAPYNPRVMPPEKKRALRASLLKHGMVLNLVVQKKSEQYGSMVLIGGHQRVKEMREICAERKWPEPTRVPMIVLDVRDAEAKQLNVALNNIEGEFDPYKLGEIFKDILPSMTAEDVLATGFAHAELEEMRSLVLPPDEQVRVVEEELGSMPEFGRSITLSIEFDTVSKRDAAKALLKQLAEDHKRKPGSVVAEALKAWASTKPRAKGKKAA